MGLLDDAKGLADKAEDLAKEHEAQVDQAVEKVGDVVDEKTGDKYEHQVDEGQRLVEDRLDRKD
jgi:hypothetical protein